MLKRKKNNDEDKSGIYIKLQNQKEEISKLKNIINEQNNRINDLSNNTNDCASEKIDDTKKFILCAGKYKGAVDIPIGCYNIKLISGQGTLETNKPDDIYFRVTNDKSDQEKYGWINTYHNLEVSEKTILKINENAKIEFSASKKYDFSKEIEEEKLDFDKKKEIINEELETVKDELNILNNDLIKKYYNFSDYSNITSQECRNKLMLLKQQEKDLRQQERDVIIQNKDIRTGKTEQNIIRQMLRTFNAECDNILFNISIKNIDSAKRQIEKSFETINKLYKVDSAALQNRLLEIKLEQATLMYTYELKYQQEKDIQKAIKEQMVEEAKAQREIDEQKKKIEKDLQQHMGEVNRLMKYLQKSQIDAEKQLYMDKIKELEDKIKLLESNKELVLEREANARAGFVYIISNIGSFGEDIYKIGMTRRLEPMDRIHELSSASVPFEFDVHAMIFSSDAPELENMLHKHFADKAVNKVNPRKEFFNVSIDEIEKVVKEEYNNTVKFTKIPVAKEYRQSINM
ncbi:MAG TPA: DUF4041 domain-containing protein [Eubacterium sp.]|nr:DUF4041 domain-containing protein [Eubacterium sp.]